MQALRVQPGSRKEAVEKVEIPKLGPEDVLVRVKSAGLAPGPITLVRQGRLNHLPATIGHEAAGIVDAVGDLVTAFKIGSRVRVHTSLSCRTCDFCLTGREQMCSEAGIMGFQGFGSGPMPLFERYRDGCLAEFVRVPQWNLDLLPDHINFDVGCKINELATSLSTLKKADLAPGSVVIITSPTGAVGTSMLKIAHFFGISRLVLVGRSAERLEAVRSLTTINSDIVAFDQLGKDWQEKNGLAQRVKSILPNGADAFIDLTPRGVDAWQALAGLKTGGRLVHLGGNSSIFPLPMVAIMRNCWSIVGTRSNSRDEAKTITRWLERAELNVDELITHRWTFDQIEEAIEVLENRGLPMWMGVINF